MRSITCASGAIRAITARQTPANSSVGAVVGEEGDRTAGITASGLSSARFALTAVRVGDQRLDHARRVVALGLDVHLQAGLARGLAGDRADRDHPRRSREAVADRGEQVADRRGRGEGDVVGARGGLDRGRVGILADRLVERDDVDPRAALGERVGQDVAGLGGAGDEHRPVVARPRRRAPRPAPRRRSAAGPRRRSPRARPARRRCRDRSRRRWRSRARARRAPAPPSPRTAAGRRSGSSGRRARSCAGRRPPREPRAHRAGARSGSPAARPPPRRGPAGSRRGRSPERGLG